MLKEFEKAKNKQTTPDCREEICSQCGACHGNLNTQFSKPFSLYSQENFLKEEITDNLQYCYRVYYQKTGNLKFLGHLDFIKLLYRMVLHGFLPVVFTKGFNKKPKLKFCQALPLGIEGENEFLDMFLGKGFS